MFTKATHIDDIQPSIRTERLLIVPMTADLARAAHADDRERVGVLVDAQVSDDWPSDIRPMLPLHADLVDRDPSALVWGPWIAIDSHARRLVADLGFKGAPGLDLTVEIGYGTIDACRGQGYATEAVSGLVDWACAQPGVAAVRAECERDNVPSLRVLEKCGFRRTGESGSLMMWRVDRRS